MKVRKGVGYRKRKGGLIFSVTTGRGIQKLEMGLFRGGYTFCFLNLKGVINFFSNIRSKEG